MLQNLALRLKAMNIDIGFESEVKSALADKGFDAVYGARPLRRAIQNDIEDALSEKILEGSVKSGDSVICSYENERFEFTVK